MTINEFIATRLRIPIKDLVTEVNTEFATEYTYDAIQKRRQKCINDTPFGLESVEREKTYQDLQKDIIADMKRHAPKYTKHNYSKVNENLLVIDPADIHIGKLAVQSETGETYNVQKAIAETDKAVDAILKKAIPFGISKICLVIGNDVLHTDNTYSATTKGTPQDTDGTWHENFKLARKLYVQIIERLMEIAPVFVVFNPSNHDYVSGFFLADTLECWFNNCKDVTFDTSIRHRKYFTFGRNLIMTSHGDEAKETDYAYLMPHEMPLEWSKTSFRYVYLHHIHHKKTVQYKSGKDFNGITIEYLRSPTPADAWHYRNGYCTAPRAVEAFIHHPTQGQIARLTTPV